ncbi:DegV family protein [Chloroflexota bacterium]
MGVQVLTDSLGDIPSKVAEDLGITIVPINVIFGDDVYRDGVDITTDQFYQKLTASKILPKTAVPPIGTFVEAYDRLAEGSDAILVITVSSKFSATYEAALQASKQVNKKCRIEVIDSLSGCMQLGLLVITAARTVKDGASLDDAVALTRRNMSRVEIRFAFDTLEYLKRGGRIGRVQALMGGLLKVNPITTIKNGEAFPVTRERSRAKAINYLCDFGMSFTRIEEMAVEDATTPGEAEQIIQHLSHKFPAERVYRSKVSPVIGAHVGPRALAVTVLGDK